MSASPPLPATGLRLLLGALALVVLPHLLHLPVWLGAACIGVIAWRAWYERRGGPLPGRTVRVGLTLLGVVAVAASYHTVIGRDAGAALLTVMVCLKLLELRAYRDAFVAAFLGYFLVLSAFFFDRSLWMGAYLFAATLLLTAALAALSHPDASRAHWRRYLRLAGTLVAQAVPLALVLFLLFPRLPGPLWSLPDQGATGRTGLSDHMAPGSITRLVDSPEVAFRVQFEGEVPPAERLYWRGPVLWRTDGRRWEGPPEWLSEPTGFRPLGGEVRYTVTLQPHERRWVFALDLPTTVPGDVAVKPGFELEAERRVEALRRDTFRSATRYRTAPPSPAQRQIALRLPEGANPRSRALAERWRDEGLAGRALMERALTYLREQPFFYTREPPPLGADPMDAFLFETRRGFCEHYAAAFTTLMRAAGLPARVVTGYQGGEVNPVGDYLVVRQSDAHAWSEVWLEGEGWTRVDPTAVVPPERVEATADAERFRSTAPAAAGEGAAWLGRAWRQVTQGWDAVNHAWNQWVLGYDHESQQRLLEALGLDGTDWRGLVAALAIGLAVAGGGLGALLFFRRPEATDPVVAAYRRFGRKLARLGLEPDPAEGPRDLGRRVVRQRPDLAGPVREITRLYIGLRYGGRRTPDRVRRLRQAVRRFRAAR